MKPKLRASFEADDDSTGELFVEVSAQHFSGVSSAWFGVSHVVEFARTLGDSYPLLKDKPVSLQGGFWTKDGTEIEQLHLGLTFYPVGARGTVGCRVQLATPLHVEDRPMQQAQLELELLTSYESVREFALGLAAIAQGQAQEALLECAEG